MDSTNQLDREGAGTQQLPPYIRAGISQCAGLKLLIPQSNGEFS